MSLEVVADNPDKIADALTAFDCLSGHYWYLSTPLTSGRGRLLGLPKGTVEDTNRAVAQSVYLGLLHRSGYTVPIINPTKLDIPGLTWNDYIVIWERVIEDLAVAVHFAPDWQYSDGCCYEFLVAHRNNIPCFEYPGTKEITGLEGAAKIGLGLNEFPAPDSIRAKVWAELQRLSHETQVC